MTKEQRQAEAEERDLKEAVKTGAMHAAFGVAFQVALGLSLGEWTAGAVGTVMFYLAWEVMQRRFKLAEGRSQKDMKPWEGFDMVNWSMDALLDLGLPVLAVGGVLAAKGFGLF